MVYENVKRKINRHDTALINKKWTASYLMNTNSIT